MTMPARDPERGAFESFLVEDVILTLGNLRGSLSWLGEGAGRSRAGIDRLDRQLGLLEDRARAMALGLHHPPPAPEPANLFAAFAAEEGDGLGDPGGDGDALDRAILDTLAGEAIPAPRGPVFRSRRA